MKTILSSETMNIPDGVSIKVHAKVIEVEGPRGKLVRDFKHLNLDFELITDDNGQKKLKIEAWFGSRKTSAAIRTALSHVENLITGVTKGYRYKMGFVYAHFPINASIANSNSSIEIRNFLSEKKSLLIIASRKHYTVDVVVAWYTVNLVVFFVEKKLPGLHISTELPDQRATTLLLQLSTKDKDGRTKEENHKLLNGNSVDPVDWRLRTQVNGKILEDGNVLLPDSAKNGA